MNNQKIYRSISNVTFQEFHMSHEPNAIHLNHSTFMACIGVNSSDRGTDSIFKEPTLVFFHVLL